MNGGLRKHYVIFEWPLSRELVRILYNMMSASRSDDIAFHPAIDMPPSAHATSSHGIKGADRIISLNSSVNLSITSLYPGWISLLMLLDSII